MNAHTGKLAVGRCTACGNNRRLAGTVPAVAATSDLTFPPQWQVLCRKCLAKYRSVEHLLLHAISNRKVKDQFKSRSEYQSIWPYFNLWDKTGYTPLHFRDVVAKAAAVEWKCQNCTKRITITPQIINEIWQLERLPNLCKKCSSSVARLSL